MQGMSAELRQISRVDFASSHAVQQSRWLHPMLNGSDMNHHLAHHSWDFLGNSGMRSITLPCPGSVFTSKIAREDSGPICALPRRTRTTLP
jgi:hypothetical protein